MDMSNITYINELFYFEKGHGGGEDLEGTIQLFLCAFKIEGQDFQNIPGHYSAVH